MDGCLRLVDRLGILLDDFCELKELRLDGLDVIEGDAKREGATCGRLSFKRRHGMVGAVLGVESERSGLNDG